MGSNDPNNLNTPVAGQHAIGDGYYAPFPHQSWNQTSQIQSPHGQFWDQAAQQWVPAPAFNS